MDDLKTTRLNTLDANWLAHVHAQAFKPSWSPKSFEDLLKLPTTYGWWICKAGAQANPMGFILFQFQEAEAEILTFVVDQSYQRSGVGRFLLNQSLIDLKHMGVVRIYLEVAVSRLAAKELYKSQGFVITGERKNYYKTKQGRENALLMHLSLND